MKETNKALILLGGSSISGDISYISNPHYKHANASIRLQIIPAIQSLNKLGLEVEILSLKK